MLWHFAGKGVVKRLVHFDTGLMQHSACQASGVKRHLGLDIWYTSGAAVRLCTMPAIDITPREGGGGGAQEALQVPLLLDDNGRSWPDGSCCTLHVNIAGGWIQERCVKEGFPRTSGRCPFSIGRKGLLRHTQLLP